MHARALEELNARLETDEHYQEVNKAYTETFSKIENALGDRYSELILTLESTTNAVLAAVEERAYRLGIEDGPKIKKEFGKQGLAFNEEEETK